MCVVAALAVACGGAPAQRVELPETKPAVVVEASRFDPAATVPTRSEDITFKVEGHEVPATISYPATGKWPGIVLMAGSGPTDRDWNSPLIPGKNGSGKLLAEWLASHGAVVVRFDKAAVGANKAAVGSITLDTYVDEIRGALGVLRAHPNADVDHLYIAGHSEGGTHAIRAAIAEGGRIAGVVLLSAAGRTMRDVLLGQLDAQFQTAARAGAVTPEVAKQQMDAIKQALDDFIEGRPVDPTTASPIPQVQALIAAIVATTTAKLSRDLLSYDPADGAAKLNVPVFVFNGLKDVQVDPQLDAARLQAKLEAAHREVTMFLAPDANHILEHETRSLVELRANLAAVNYNAADRKLDDTALSALGNWLAQHSHK
jgi:pimeloyl-ACP methyl ester carboxylesterase